jgi:ribosome-associated protein YbcJ (S4-like RNA binding protein)
MQGREIKPEKRKTKKLSHDDSVSVELADAEYSED